MKTVVMHPSAEREMNAAARFYEERSPGLGGLLLDEAERGIRRIAEHPEAWSVVSPTVRRCLFIEFPFGIIYRIELHRIYVLAVMHLRREPDFWKSRL